MNISLQLEPIDCSFYNWPSETYTTQSSDTNNSNNNNSTNTDDTALVTVEKNQKQTLRCRHAMDELLQTERDYTDHLTHLVTVCFDRILQRQKWIMDQHKKIIIRNANELLRFHQTLLAALEKACLDQDILTRCGQLATVFLDMGSSFTLYDTYCDKHDAAIALCNEYRSKPEWLIFTKDCAIPITIFRSDNSSLDQTTKPLQFEDYLIKPVQRVCRYQLLLKEILHYTPRNTTEFRRLDCALGMMQAVVSGIDRRKYHRDTTERTRLFIERLDSSLSDGRLDKDSLHLLGNLVMAGAIEVTYSSLGQTNVSSSSRSKYLGCFIFPTYLIMIRPKKVTSYAPKHWFPLRLVELEDLQDINDQREHAFVVRCKKHCFAFTATCQREKRLWMTKLSQAIAEAKSQPRSADNFIVSSLHGIVKPAKIRTSRSVTNLLDFGRDSSSITTCSDGDGKSSFGENQIVKRSKSHSFQLASYYNSPPSDTTISTIASPPPPPPSSSSFTQTSTTATASAAAPLIKRYSADFAPPRTTTKKRNALKPRIHSEMYIRPPAPAPLSRPPSEFGNVTTTKLQRQRPGSMVMMSTSSSQLSLNMIGKIKNNHQHALRMGTDHKLREVCTQDYLSSRSWSTLLRESSNGHYSNNSDHTSSNSTSSSSTTNTTSSSSPTANNGRRKSSLSNLRSSASTFSMLMMGGGGGGASSSESSRRLSNGFHSINNNDINALSNRTTMDNHSNKKQTSSDTTIQPPMTPRHQKQKKLRVSMSSASTSLSSSSSSSSSSPSVARFTTGIPRYTQPPPATTTAPPAAPCYGSIDFQQYYNGKCINGGLRRQDILPSLTTTTTSTFAQNHQANQKKKTLRASLSTYSLHLQPKKSPNGIKHAFVDGFRRFSPGQHKQQQQHQQQLDLSGRGMKDTALSNGFMSSKLSNSPPLLRNNNMTKRSSRLFSWINKPDPRPSSSITSTTTTINNNNDSMFSSSTLSTSTTATSTTSGTFLQPRASVTTAMATSTFPETRSSTSSFGKDNHVKSNWSRKWISSRK